METSPFALLNHSETHCPGSIAIIMVKWSLNHKGIQLNDEAYEAWDKDGLYLLKDGINNSYVCMLKVWFSFQYDYPTCRQKYPVFGPFYTVEFPVCLPHPLFLSLACHYFLNKVSCLWSMTQAVIRQACIVRCHVWAGWWPHCLLSIAIQTKGHIMKPTRHQSQMSFCPTLFNPFLELQLGN